MFWSLGAGLTGLFQLNTVTVSQLVLVSELVSQLVTRLTTNAGTGINLALSFTRKRPAISSPTLNHSRQKRLTESSKLLVHELTGYKARHISTPPGRHLNFENIHESAAKINRWCGQKTASQIKQIIDRAQLTRASSLIRINAIYSKATWHHQFNAKNTSERDFFMESGYAVPVRMMTKILNLKTCENIPLLNAGVCQLPYKWRN